MTNHFTLGVVGNPNAGKTTLFNALTGAKQKVGNWPGVTVERKIGAFNHHGTPFTVIDLPGTYSLDVTNEDVSLDEKIARDFVHDNEADLIVNIVDASNLERNLYLTTQLIEMRKPMIVVVNMIDTAESMGMKIDTQAMAERLGCPVVPAVATKSHGIDQLKNLIHTAAESHPIPTATFRYDETLEAGISALQPTVASTAKADGSDPRWLASRLIEGDGLARQIVDEALVSEETLIALRDDLSDDVDILLADGRYDFAHDVVLDVVARPAEISRHRSDKIDHIVLNRVLGIPVFLAVMYLMFMFTINVGGSFIDFFDIAFGAVFVEGAGSLLESLGLPEIAVLLLADGIGGGIQVIATFIPVIAFLYLFLSVLEDSGYMARAAFVMDRAMRAIGLPGKSFVPLIVGFGCNVPAIMSTRTLENHRDRLMTIIMTPFMSCGARLPVYALFAAAFFPVGGQNIVFGLYLIGIAIAVLTGLIMKNTLLKGEASPFIMELPPYHLPTAKGVLTRVWERTYTFVTEAGKVIVPMVLVLNVLNAIGTDGSFGNENSGKSVLSAVGRTIAPVFSPMGLDEENWPATVGIFTGILAKEAVVGTLDSLYTSLAASDFPATAGAEETPSIQASLIAALQTIPANLGNALGTWADPIGVDIGDVSDQESAAQAQKVASGTFGAMANRFDGAAGAFAYLLFILLYSPCSAALAAVYRESDGIWTLFVAAWSTGLAYISATIFYQAAIFSRAPNNSTIWLTSMAGLLAAAIMFMRWWGHRKAVRAYVAAEEAP